MAIFTNRMAVAGFALATLVLSAIVPTEARAQTVDPAAVKILQRTMDYLASLQQFSVHTQNTVEEVLVSGQKIQFDYANGLTVQRPNKLLAKRHGDIVDQSFSYDGKTLSLYNASHNYYASVAAPGSIEGMLDFARESLDLVAPASDLLYRNAFPLMMEHVYSAMIIGKAVIGGVKCDHLLFSRPGVDFQVWVADAGKPLPYKYVVTDTGIPGRLSVTTVMSKWNVAPAVDDARFSFVPPQGVKKISFMPVK